MKHAGATIAEIAYLHSDAAFLFPIVPEAPFGAELLALADAQRPNAHGRPCRVHRMQTYPDALDVAKNAGASSVVSVLTLAQGLPKMAENLRAAAQRSQAMVVHVAGAEVDAETFELRPAAGAAYDLASTGAAVVVASSPLGCADSAMYCYALAHSLRRPVVHLVDGMLGLAARSSAALSWDALSSRAQMVHRQQPAAGAGHPLELGDFHAFGYHGDRSARAVFVAVGGAIHSAHRAVESHAGHGLGLVAVQLVEPWHEERFLELLPHSTQLVIVLDYASQARPLHQRVQSAVGRSAQLRAVATLNVECSTSEDTDVDRLLQLAASHGRGFGAGPGGAPLSIAQVPAASSGAGPAVPGARQFKLWWSPSAEAAQSEQLFAALAAGTGHVDCAGYHDVYHKAGHERAVTDVLVTSTPGLHLNHAICRADMAVVYRTELLDDVDVFASLRDGGIALLNCPTNHIAKHRIVPADAAQRQLRIYQVNANEAGRICRTDADLVMCICATFLAATSGEAMESFGSLIERDHYYWATQSSCYHWTERTSCMPYRLLSTSPSLSVFASASAATSSTISSRYVTERWYVMAGSLAPLPRVGLALHSLVSPCSIAKSPNRPDGLISLYRLYSFRIGLISLRICSSLSPFLYMVASLVPCSLPPNDMS